ncbi:hypothetical protein YB2330_005093 [Saitoella coloradoensis]
MENHFNNFVFDAFDSNESGAAGTGTPQPQQHANPYNMGMGMPFNMSGNQASAQQDMSFLYNSGMNYPGVPQQFYSDTSYPGVAPAHQQQPGAPIQHQQQMMQFDPSQFPPAPSHMLSTQPPQPTKGESQFSPPRTTKFTFTSEHKEHLEKEFESGMHYPSTEDKVRLAQLLGSGSTADSIGRWFERKRKSAGVRVTKPTKSATASGAAVAVQKQGQTGQGVEESSARVGGLQQQQIQQYLSQQAPQQTQPSQPQFVMHQPPQAGQIQGQAQPIPIMPKPPAPQQQQEHQQPQSQHQAPPPQQMPPQMGHMPSHMMHPQYTQHQYQLHPQYLQQPYQLMINPYQAPGMLNVHDPMMGASLNPHPRHVIHAPRAQQAQGQGQVTVQPQNIMPGGIRSVSIGPGAGQQVTVNMGAMGAGKGVGAYQLSQSLPNLPFASVRPGTPPRAQDPLTPVKSKLREALDPAQAEKDGNITRDKLLDIMSSASTATKGKDEEIATKTTILEAMRDGARDEMLRKVLVHPSILARLRSWLLAAWKEKDKQDFVVVGILEVFNRAKPTVAQLAEIKFGKVMVTILKKTESKLIRAMLEKWQNRAERAYAIESGKPDPGPPKRAGQTAQTKRSLEAEAERKGSTDDGIYNVLNKPDNVANDLLSAPRKKMREDIAAQSKPSTASAIGPVKKPLGTIGTPAVRIAAGTAKAAAPAKPASTTSSFFANLGKKAEEKPNVALPTIKIAKKPAAAAPSFSSVLQAAGLAPSASDKSTSSESSSSTKKDKPKSKKRKRVTWNDAHLEQIKIFETVEPQYDDFYHTEHESKVHKYGNARDLDIHEGRVAFGKEGHLDIEEEVEWYEPRAIELTENADSRPLKRLGIKNPVSPEAEKQVEREGQTLMALYDENDMPTTATEPKDDDEENFQPQREIPLPAELRVNPEAIRLLGLKPPEGPVGVPPTIQQVQPQVPAAAMETIAKLQALAQQHQQPVAAAPVAQPAYTWPQQAYQPPPPAAAPVAAPGAPADLSAIMAQLAKLVPGAAPAAAAAPPPTQQPDLAALLASMTGGAGPALASYAPPPPAFTPQPPQSTAYSSSSYGNYDRDRDNDRNRDGESSSKKKGPSALRQYDVRPDVADGSRAGMYYLACEYFVRIVH